MKTKILVAFISVFVISTNLYAVYCPDMRRFLSRDPIDEPGFRATVQSTAQVTGGVKLLNALVNKKFEPEYTFVMNDPINHWDYLGLVKICCRGIKDAKWYEKPLKHCEPANYCRQGEEEYPVWIDKDPNRALDNGKPCSCATKDDIAKCYKRNRYSIKPLPGSYGYENNCQTGTSVVLGKCCLKSTWDPNFYAGYRGRCLKWLSGGRGSAPVCIQWELPDWKASDLPNNGWNSSDIPPQFPWDYPLK